jgi:hypothetical protein
LERFYATGAVLMVDGGNTKVEDKGSLPGNSLGLISKEIATETAWPAHTLVE